MAKNLKLFNTHADYEQYISAGYPKPNVSLCKDDKGLHYNAVHYNILKYTATAKLPEVTTQNESGLHTYAFSGKKWGTVDDKESYI